MVGLYRRGTGRGSEEAKCSPRVVSPHCRVPHHALLSVRTNLPIYRYTVGSTAGLLCYYFCCAAQRSVLSFFTQQWPEDSHVSETTVHSTQMYSGTLIANCRLDGPPPRGQKTRKSLVLRRQYSTTSSCCSLLHGASQATLIMGGMLLLRARLCARPK